MSDMDDMDSYEDSKKDLDPDEEDQANMAKALKFKSCLCLSGDNKIRQLFVWITQLKWFDRIILILILINCIILAIQTPIAGPAVLCTNDLQINATVGDYGFNCGPPLIENDADKITGYNALLDFGGSLPGRGYHLAPTGQCTRYTTADQCKDDPTKIGSDSASRHKEGCYWDDGVLSGKTPACYDPDCNACQLQGKCSCAGPLKPGVTNAQVASESEMFFTIAFTFECLVKVISYGFIMHPGSYLRSGWNWLDWVVVVMSWVTIVFGLNNVSSIRTVRVLRPLRTMSRIPNMNVIVGAMLKSIAPLGNVMLLCSVIFFIFGILGVQFWYNLPKMYCGPDALYYNELNHWNEAGSDFRCWDLNTHTVSDVPCGCDQLGGGCDEQVKPSPNPQCIGASDDSGMMYWYEDMDVVDETNNVLTWVDHPVSGVNSTVALTDAVPKFEKVFYNYNLDGAGCGCGEVCTTALYFYCDSKGALNFDHVGTTMITIFQCVTLEGWTDIMYRVDETGFPGGWTFFLALIFFAGFFIVNLALAVIADSYNDSREEDNQRKDEELQAKKEQEQEELSGPGKAAKGGCARLSDWFGKKFKRSQKANDMFLIAPIRVFVAEDGRHAENFTWFVMLFIGINTVLLACDYHSDTNQDEYAGMDEPTLSWCDELTLAKSVTGERATALQAGANASFYEENVQLLSDKVWTSGFFDNDVAKDGMLLPGVKCMSPALTTFLEWANIFLTVFFLLEMLLKIVGLGIVEYTASAFNLFDAFIVCTSIFELIMFFASKGEQAGGFITVLRAGRLFRVFKLARKWTDLNDVLRTVIKSFSSLLPLSVILCLFMFIYSLLGMQLYGGAMFFPTRGDCNPWEDCSIPRANFDDFGTSFVAIFQMMTGEDWNVVMYDGIAATSTASFFYFMVLVVFGNYIILNLFLAILLEGFGPDDGDDEEDEEEEEETEGSAPKKGCLAKMCCCGGGKVAPDAEAAAEDEDDEDGPMGLHGAKGIRSKAKQEQDLIDADAKTMPSQNALICFSHTNPVRRFCFAVYIHPWFDGIVLIGIFLSSVALAVQNPVCHCLLLIFLCLSMPIVDLSLPFTDTPLPFHR